MVNEIISICLTDFEERPIVDSFPSNNLESIRTEKFIRWIPPTLRLERSIHLKIIYN